MPRRYLVFLGSIAITAPAAAQETGTARAGDPIVLREAPADEAFITVLASGVRETLDTTGKAVSVFGRDEMDSLQGPDLARLLERAPGVSLSRNGGPGSFTGVRVRGAEAEQLLVLIDGVRVADVAAPGGGFDFGNLLMGNLAKVELQRSSNSTIWGSQALGGVLAATTGGEGAFGSIEYGAHDTLYGAAGFGLEAGPARLGMQAAHYESDGFSAAAGGSEPDGFRQSEAAANARVAPVQGLTLFANGRYADGRVALDGFPAPAFALADTAEYQDTRQLSGAGGLAYASVPLTARAAYSFAETERENFDPAAGRDPGFATDGASERAEVRGRWAFAGDLSLDFGAEREWMRFSTQAEPPRRSASWGAYAQLDYGHGPLYLAAGVRRDGHRDFGSAWSFGADASYRIAYGIRARASYGEGFKAPTLFQLHSEFGNAALRPERSRSYDLGLELGGGPLGVRLTAFRRDTNDLIGFVSCFGVTTGVCAGRPFGTYANVGRARAQGLELEGELRLRSGVTARLAYGLLEAEDRTRGSASRGNALARRPAHTLTMSGDWEVSGAVRLGADLRAVSSSYDDAANLVPLEDYATLGVRGEWDAGAWLTLYGRVENLWDEDYQTAAGYATGGRAAHVGARVRW